MKMLRKNGKLKGGRSCHCQKRQDVQIITDTFSQMIVSDREENVADSVTTDEENADDIFPWLISLEESNCFVTQNSDQLLEAFIAKQNKFKKSEPNSDRNAESLRRLSLEVVKFEPKVSPSTSNASRRNSFSFGEPNPPARMKLNCHNKANLQIRTMTNLTIPKLKIESDALEENSQSSSESEKSEDKSEMIHLIPTPHTGESSSWTETSRASELVSSSTDRSSSAYCSSRDSKSLHGDVHIYLEDEQTNLEEKKSYTGICHQISDRSSCSDSNWYEIEEDPEIDICTVTDEVKKEENEQKVLDSHRKKVSKSSTKCERENKSDRIIDSLELKKARYNSIQKLHKQFKLKSTGDRLLVNKNGLQPIISTLTPIKSQKKNDSEEKKYKIPDLFSEDDFSEVSMEESIMFQDHDNHIENTDFANELLTITSLQNGASKSTKTVVEPTSTEVTEQNSDVDFHPEERSNCKDGSLSFEHTDYVPRSSSPDEAPPVNNLQQTIDSRLKEALATNSLNLGGLQLPFYPTAILCTTLTNLTRLTLKDNSLVELPTPSLSLLPHLRWLDVRYNRLTSLPGDEVKTIERLEVLLMQGNLVTTLPLQIGSLRNLRTLQTSGNPLKFPPKFVMESGTEAVISFLNDRLVLNEHLSNGGCWNHSMRCCYRIQCPVTDYSEDSTTAEELRTDVSKRVPTEKMLDKSGEDRLENCSSSSDFLADSTKISMEDWDGERSESVSLNFSPDSGRDTFKTLEKPSTPTSPCLLTPNSEFPTSPKPLSEIGLKEYKPNMEILCMRKMKNSSPLLEDNLSLIRKVKDSNLRTQLIENFQSFDQINNNENKTVPYFINQQKRSNNQTISRKRVKSNMGLSLTGFNHLKKEQTDSSLKFCHQNQGIDVENQNLFEPFRNIGYADASHKKRSYHLVLNSQRVYKERQESDEDSESLSGDIGEGYRKPLTTFQQQQQTSSRNMSVSIVEPVIVQLCLPSPKGRRGGNKGPKEGVIAPRERETALKSKTFGLSKSKTEARTAVLSSSLKDRQNKLQRRESEECLRQLATVSNKTTLRKWRREMQEKNKRRTFNRESHLPSVVLAPFEPEFDLLTPRTRQKAMKKFGWKPAEEKVAVDSIMADARKCLTQLKITTKSSSVVPSGNYSKNQLGITLPEIEKDSTFLPSNEDMKVDEDSPALILKRLNKLKSQLSRLKNVTL